MKATSGEIDLLRSLGIKGEGLLRRGGVEDLDRRRPERRCLSSERDLDLRFIRTLSLDRDLLRSLERLRERLRGDLVRSRSLLGESDLLSLVPLLCPCPTWIPNALNCLS